MARIGIFGGSFNPPHSGHLLAVAEFRKKLALDQVLLIPAAQPPHKHLTAGSPDARTRLELTRLAVSNLPFAKVSDLELRREGVSYTADTLAELHKCYPQDELFLLMGTDMFFTFQQWSRPEEIAKLATIAVAHRDEDDPQMLLDCAERLRESCNANVILVENTYLTLSSTTVRAMLAFGCGEEYLVPAVYNAIASKKLYYVHEELQRLPFERLAEISLSLHNPKRVPHVVGCSATAAMLAERYGADAIAARRAGILHDVTKALGGDEQLKLCKKYGIILDNFERKNTKLLHAKTGAAVASQIFGESDVVRDAIFWHTTGRADMTLQQKILYLADYMEPNRDFEGVEEMRRLAERDLDAALLFGLEMSLEQLKANGREIDANSLAALNFLKHERVRHE